MLHCARINIRKNTVTCHIVIVMSNDTFKTSAGKTETVIVVAECVSALLLFILKGCYECEVSDCNY